MKIKKSKPRLTIGGIIQLIGFIGIIFCIVNLFTKFNLSFSVWWIFGISIVFYILGTLSETTLEIEISKKVDLNNNGTTEN